MNHIAKMLGIALLGWAALPSTADAQTFYRQDRGGTTAINLGGLLNGLFGHPHRGYPYGRPAYGRPVYAYPAPTYAVPQQPVVTYVQPQPTYVVPQAATGYVIREQRVTTSTSSGHRTVARHTPARRAVSALDVYCPTPMTPAEAQHYAHAATNIYGSR